MALTKDFVINVFERNKKISGACKNLEDMFYGIHSHDILLTQEDLNNLKEEIKILLEAIEDYPIKEN